MNQAQIALLVLTVLFEGYSQPDLGKALIAKTALARQEICQCPIETVLFQPHQYRCWEVKLWNRIPARQVKLAWFNCTLHESWPDPSCLPFEVDEEWWSDTWSLIEQVYYSTYPIPERYEGVLGYDNPLFWLKYDGNNPASNGYTILGDVGDHRFWGNEFNYTIERKGRGAEIRTRISCAFR